MSADLSYVHRSPPSKMQETPSHMPSTAQTNSDPREIERHLLQQAAQAHAATSAAAKIQEEARDWKRKHDSLATAARELAFKTTSANKDLDDLKARHQNLQENHAQMQTKYRSLKEEMHQGVPEHTAALKQVARWKDTCKELASKFETHLRSTKEMIQIHQEQKDHLHKKLAKARDDENDDPGELDHMFAGLIEAQTETDLLHKELKAQTARTEKLERDKARLAKEVEYLKSHATRADNAERDKARLAKELDHIKQEIPEVKAKLHEGRTHADMIKGLQKQLTTATAAQAASTELVKGIQRQLETERRSNLTMSAELLKLKQEIPTVKSRIREGQLATQELAAAQEKLRAANQTISAHTNTNSRQQSETHELRASSQQHMDVAKSCARMLSSTAQVLRVCSDLHAQQGSPLHEELKETVAKVNEFLGGLGATSQMA